MAILEILITVLLTAGCVIGGAAWILPRLVHRSLQKEWEEIAPELREQVRLGMIDALESEETTEAITALEISIEERVRSGLVDAVTDMASGAPIRESTKTVTQAGASLVEGGLQVLFQGLTGGAQETIVTEDDEK